MTKKKLYLILRNSSVNELEDSVNEYIEEGYRVTGTLTFVNGWYVQAMCVPRVFEVI